MKQWRSFRWVVRAGGNLGSAGLEAVSLAAEHPGLGMMFEADVRIVFLSSGRSEEE